MSTRRVVLRIYGGIVGTDSAEFYTVDSSVSQQDLEDYAQQRAADWAESFGVYPEWQRPEEEDEDDTTEYSDDISGWFEDYNPDEHDGLRCGGECDDYFPELMV